MMTLNSMILAGLLEAKPKRRMTDSDWANIWMCAWNRLKETRSQGDWETCQMAAQIKVR